MPRHIEERINEIVGAGCVQVFQKIINAKKIIVDN
jgi:hypothetical protein